MSPAWFTGLLDDAAVFPPGLMPLPDAVRAHARHTASPYAALVGPLVIAASALPDLAALLGPHHGTPPHGNGAEPGAGASRSDVSGRGVPLRGTDAGPADSGGGPGTSSRGDGAGPGASGGPDGAAVLPGGLGKDTQGHGDGSVEPGGRLDIAITFPGGPGHLTPALAAAAALPVRVLAVEVAVPPAMRPDAFFAELDRARDAVGDAEVFVEIPRDERGPELIAACAATGDRAKFRTGGVKAELYPDEAELAAAVHAAVHAGVPFKATAGLHHAVRNTDPGTGFEQHGFLNLLLAVDAALDGHGEPALAAVLAERDGRALAARLTGRGDARAEAVRARFLSFGTCSIAEPLAELAALGLVPASFTGLRGATS